MALPDLTVAVGCSAELAGVYGPLLDEACSTFAINTDARLAAFLAQIGEESGSFRYTTELATGAAYEDRRDLGNVFLGDGVKFKGRGLIQITGRSNYAQVTSALAGSGAPDFTNIPSALAEPRWATLSAGWYWSSRGCNELADQGNFEAITRKINGGLNGEADREARWTKAKSAIGLKTSSDTAASVEASGEDPQPPGAKPMFALLPFALNAILAAIPALASKWGNDGTVVAQRNTAIATTVVQAAIAATGAVNEQHLVEKLQSDPAAVQQVKDAVQEMWWQIDTTGQDAARKSDAGFLAPTAKGFWYSPAFWISILLIAMPFMLLSDVFYMHADKYDSNMRTQIITATLAIIFVVSGYWIGTSASSARKTELAAGSPPQA